MCVNCTVIIQIYSVYIYILYYTEDVTVCKEQQSGQSTSSHPFLFFTHCDAIWDLLQYTHLEKFYLYIIYIYTCLSIIVEC